MHLREEDYQKDYRYYKQFLHLPYEAKANSYNDIVCQTTPSPESSSLKSADNNISTSNQLSINSPSINGLQSNNHNTSQTEFFMRKMHELEKKIEVLKHISAKLEKEGIKKDKKIKALQKDKFELKTYIHQLEHKLSSVEDNTYTFPHDMQRSLY